MVRRCAFELVLDGAPRSVLLSEERASSIHSVGDYLRAVDSQLQETCGSPWVLSSRCSKLSEVGDSPVGSCPCDRLFAGAPAEAGGVSTLWTLGDAVCFPGHLAKEAPATPLLLHAAKFAVTAVSRLTVDVSGLHLPGVSVVEVPVTRASLGAEVQAQLAGQLAAHGVSGAVLEQMQINAGAWHNDLCLEQSMAEQGMGPTASPGGLWDAPAGALRLCCIGSALPPAHSIHLSFPPAFCRTNFPGSLQDPHVAGDICGVRARIQRRVFQAARLRRDR